MAKEETCGIPDPISIDFSRRVRDALKQRERRIGTLPGRSPPWRGRLGSRITRYPISIAT